MVEIQFDSHPRLAAAFFVCELPAPLGELTTPDWILPLLNKQGSAPLTAAANTKDQVRALLRAGGFKPSGRSKPASEFLEKMQQGSGLTNINLAVDLCNIVSLWSGFPISVLDLDLLQAPLKVGVVTEKVGYVFNPSGQELDLEGLICIHDALGPCGSPVKDSQRTKTHALTRRTLSLIWGEHELQAQVAESARWYQELCRRAHLAPEEIREVCSVDNSSASR